MLQHFCSECCSDIDEEIFLYNGFTIDSRLRCPILSWYTWPSLYLFTKYIYSSKNFNIKNRILFTLYLMVTITSQIINEVSLSFWELSLTVNNILIITLIDFVNAPVEVNAPIETLNKLIQWTEAAVQRCS